MPVSQLNCNFVCRFEDLFRVPIAMLKSATLEDRKKRDKLILKFGKTGRTVHRPYYLPDFVCYKLRPLIKHLNQANDQNLFGVKTNGDNKNRIRKFIADQV